MSNSRHLQDTLNPKPLEVGQKLYLAYSGEWVGRIYTVNGSWIKMRLRDEIIWRTAPFVRAHYEVR